MGLINNIRREAKAVHQTEDWIPDSKNRPEATTKSQKQLDKHKISKQTRGSREPVLRNMNPRVRNKRGFG